MEEILKRLEILEGKVDKLISNQSSTNKKLNESFKQINQEFSDMQKTIRLLSMNDNDDISDKEKVCRENGFDDILDTLMGKKK